jgi:hypothetical protein
MTVDLRLLFFLLLIANFVHADDERIASGRVLDEGGKSVARADVSFYWRANGSPNDKNGKPYDMSSPEAQRIYWGNIGKMEPFWESPAPAQDGRGRQVLHEGTQSLSCGDGNGSESNPWRTRDPAKGM